MDPTSLQTLLETFQNMAKSNQELVAAVQAGATQPATATLGDVASPAVPAQDTAGAVALTNIKIPLDMGDSA